MAEEEKDRIFDNMLETYKKNHTAEQAVQEQRPAEAREPAEWIRINHLSEAFSKLIHSVQENPMPVEYAYSDNIPALDYEIIRYAQARNIIRTDEDSNTFVLDENFVAQIQEALPAEAKNFAEQNQNLIPLPEPESATVQDYEPAPQLPDYIPEPVAETENEPSHQQETFEH